MADTALSYDFLPWARRGLARAHAATQALGQPALPQVTVGLQVTGSGAATATGDASVPLKMFGPADVVGIDPRGIVRCEPRANARNVEPNYLAAIEFDAPDFPWMLTPARADAQKRLAPWLVLLVLRSDEITAAPTLRPGRVLASVSLRSDAPVPLPKLAESWMWAHSQLVRNTASPNPALGLQHDPERNLSRLVCPRRLQPGVDYIACLVPAFDAGVKAGLGQPVPANAVLGPAWASDAASGIELPVYFHWSFSTGPAGDFETLARRLQCPQDYVGNKEISAKLAGLGRIATEVDADRLLQQGAVTPELVRGQYMAQYQGALLSLSKQQPPPEPGRGDAIATRLASILNAGDQRALGNLALQQDPEVPLVGPPAYGVWHARRHSLVPAQRGTHWVDGLNLSVPNRMAAGVGTRVVQAHQEEFMQAAWAQAGEVIKAERLLNRAHMAQRSLDRITHRVSQLPPVRQLQLLAPCAARLQPGALAPGLTLWAYQRNTSLPDQAFDGALRRSLSPVRPVLRAAARRELAAAQAQGLEGPQAAARAALPLAAARQLVQAYAKSETAEPLAAAERFRADGFAGLKALDGLQLHAGPEARFSLPGFIDPLPLAQVQQLVAQQAKVRQVNLPGAWQSAPVSVKTRGGVLLDSHWQRLGQLTSALAADQQLQPADAARVPMTAVSMTDMARSVVSAARSQPEGVLVSVERQAAGLALAPAQALRVDARNGNVAVGKALVPLVGPRGAVASALDATVVDQALTNDLNSGVSEVAGSPRAVALKSGQLAKVDVSSIRRLGNAALFNSLPGNVVQPASANRPNAVPQVQAGANGLFKNLQAAADLPAEASALGSRQSITLLPPDRSEAVLSRFRSAWADKIEREASPALPPGVRSALVTFDATSAARASHSAIDVAQLVPQRVASLLDLGGNAVSLLHPPAFGVIGDALRLREQFVINPLRDRVMAYPHLDEPLYKRLVDVDRDAFMPGVEDIPQDTILLTATNPRFVESFLVGSNHEMNRELLWRGFPTDQRGTPFQKFWPYFDSSWQDILPIHTWPQALPIGKAGGAQGQKGRLALVVRGELLRRYPNTNIYAVQKGPTTETEPAFSGTAPAPHAGPRETRHPIGGGLLPPDITFFLFDIEPEKADLWWWVLEEPMTEPRFGFDDQEQPRAVPRIARRGGTVRHMQARAAFNLLAPENAGETWLDVDWSELPGVGNGENQNPHLRLQDLAGVRLANASLQLNAQAHAAQVAQALLQRPFRGYFAGTRLQSA